MQGAWPGRGLKEAELGPAEGGPSGSTLSGESSGETVPMLTLRLDGLRICDIPSFYDEINRVFMAGEDWRLGPSLDALDDMLRGGYGALHNTEEARVIWAEHAASAEALGVEVTRAQLLAKLEDPRFDQAIARRKLDRLVAEGGPTYFDTVLEVFADHPRIELVLA